MKPFRFVSILVLILTTLLGRFDGQTWGEGNPIWTYAVYDFSSSGRIQWSVKGDTTFSGHTCKMFRKDFEIKNCSLNVISSGTLESFDFMYEEDQVVYWFNSELLTFDTLFAFDSGPGFSWVISAPKSYDMDVTCKIVDTSTISLQDITRKQIVINFSANRNYDYEYSDTIIAGIGPISTYMKPWDVIEGAIDGEHEGDALLCFQDDEINLERSKDANCNLISSVNFPSTKHEYLLYPNPAQDQISIILPSWSPMAVYQIFGPSGELISSKPKLDQAAIDLQDLLPGLYWMKLRVNEGVISLPFVKS